MGKIPKILTEYTLNAESIDLISEDLSTYCQAFLSEEIEIIKRRLVLEGCLLTWLSAGLEGYKITVIAKRKLFRYGFTVAIRADAPDPFVQTDEELGDFSSRMMSALGLAPIYSQSHGLTQLTFVFKREVNPIVSLCAVIAASVIIGYLGLAFVPTDILNHIMEGFITPIYDRFFDILRCIAGPMVFLSVAWGVYGIGDATTLGHIGKRIFVSYLLITLLGALFGLASFPVLGGSLTDSANLDNAQFSSLFNLFLGIVPPDIFSPFINGNTLQIIFLALVMGCGLLFIGQQVSAIANIVEQVNLIVMFCMEIISKLVPFFIFLIILNLCWSDSLGALLPTWRLLVTMAVMFVIMAAVFTVFTAVHMGKSPLAIMKFNITSFLISLTTASSAAAFNETVTTCVKNYRISSKLISFAVPIGMVMHNPYAALLNVTCTIFFATSFNVSISIPWLITAVIVGTIVAIATPPIPGGAVAAYTMLFTQMGIPAEALAIVIAIDAITDFMVTSCEMYSLPMTVWHVAKSLNLLQNKPASK